MIFFLRRLGDLAGKLFPSLFCWGVCPMTAIPPWLVSICMGPLPRLTTAQFVSVLTEGATFLPGRLWTGEPLVTYLCAILEVPEA